MSLLFSSWPPARGDTPGLADLDDFGTRYAAAWSSGDPGRLASFYAEDGSLVVNGTVHEGRDGGARDGRRLHGRLPRHAGHDGLGSRPGRRTRRVLLDVDRDEYRAGRDRADRCDLQGYEEWTFTADDEDRRSDGHYDQTEYRLQVTGETE